jgi:tripartite-type tricarboxylate transporter receptor subunit TctC
MSAKISEELAKRLEEAEAAEADREIPVIVTIAAGSDLEVLKRKGLKVERVFENVPAVAGTLGAADVQALAEADQVEKVEYNGEVHAL